jgi:hypothetical protein
MRVAVTHVLTARGFESLPGNFVSELLLRLKPLSPIRKR